MQYRTILHYISNFRLRICYVFSLTLQHLQNKIESSKFHISYKNDSFNSETSKEF